MDAPTIATRYNESFMFLQAKKKRQSQQLGLLNNLRRGDQYIASSLLLTLFNRILASLYDDKLQVKFLPSQGITQNQLNSFNVLAQSDYLEMGKAKLDYDWCWDALFFGRGYMETMRFDKKRKIMQPHVINPLAFGYDPYSDNPQDWRYYWKWLTKNRWELEALLKAGVLKNITSVDELPAGYDQYLWDYKQRVDNARDGTVPSSIPSSNDVFQILEFFGYNKNGKKSVYWLDKNRARIIFEQELDFQDGEKIVAPDGSTIDTNSRWPIVVKEAFREPHSSIPFSVADLLEDKHRAKSVLLNLAYVAAKDQANPLYGYNPDKVRDVSQFFQRQINQHIPMDDESAAWPIAKNPSMSPDLLSFINVLTQEANEPMGTGTALQPQKGNQETATEIAIEQQLNDLAQSLQSKVLQFGEAEFWSHWFHRYAKNSNLGEKMANIVGAKGIDTKIVDLADFQTNFPPGVMVYSAREAEYKDLVLRRDLMQVYPQVTQTMDMTGIRNFNKYVFFPKFLQDPSLVDIIYPKTLDEISAEEENEELKQDKLPQVKETDDHQTHIYIHRSSMPKSWGTWVHVGWHEEMLAQQKAQEMQAQQMQMMGGQPEMGQSPAPGQAPKNSPLEAASPLKKETLKTKVKK